MKLFFGGSFDPVHLGHLVVARDVMEVMGFEKVVFVPAFQAPLKEPHLASPQDRLEMLKLALEDFECFELSDMEVVRGGVSYTVDTVKEIYNQTGERPFFLVGADGFLNLHLWKEPLTLVSMVRFVVVDREDKSYLIKSYIRERFPHLREEEDFSPLSVRRIDVSSTEVRERIRKGKSIKWLVPDKVEEFIKVKKLYAQTEIKTTI
ncbi:MAG: nicotinate-nucleotide adenylyltransferase [Aquificaceae bacterium]|nr:nicotinate-nucleotide adenylyltransferase [Aquificaceae bacterium]